MLEIIVILGLLLFIAIVVIFKQSDELFHTKSELHDLKHSIKVISDHIPETPNAQSYALQLSNELKNYFVIDNENDTVTLMVIDPFDE